MNLLIHILKNIVDTEQHDIVYIWILCKYLKEGLKIMPKKLEFIPPFKKKKIEIDNKLDYILKVYNNEILSNVSETYLKWIEEELSQSPIPNIII